MRYRILSNLRAPLPIIGGLGFCCLLSGCYEHVVRVKGNTRSDVQIYEPNLKENERIPVLDDVSDWLTGSQKADEK